MTTRLSDTELRVLAVLIEKSLTHPNSYPLTLNAIVLGANQKQNREPVLDLSEGEVAGVLYRLQQKELADNAPPSPGARANRFEHKVVENFHWDRREQAVMAELILRGRQTAGELRTRGSRMTPIPDLEAVNAILGELMRRDPPFVEELSREPGRSANRFRHLLSDGDSPSADVATSATEERAADAAISAPERRTAAVVGGDMGSPEGDDDSGLAGRVARLEQQVASLMADVEELKKNVAPPVDRPGPSPV